MKNLYTVIGLALFFAIGFKVSWDSQNFLVLSSNLNSSKVSRDPAAIKKVYDFSNLEGSALDFAAKQRLLDGANVIRDQKDVGIELGHFVIRDSEGQKIFACQRYSKVILNFRGEGVAVAGELPVMEVEGNCEISKDINRIAALWIPVSKILGEPVSDGEFDFREERPVKLKFVNVSDQWPSAWQLQSIKLVDPSGSNSEMSIPFSDLKQMLKRPFIVTF
jgi:hypothetical protein